MTNSYFIILYYYKNIVPINKYKLHTYDECGGFVKLLSSMSDVVSLNNVFKSTDLGSSICDVPKI